MAGAYDNPLAAQQVMTGEGAYSSSMGHASVTSTNIWSAANNPAGLALLETPAAGIYAEQPFAVEGIQMGGLSAAAPIQDIGVLGLSGRILGFRQTYSQQRWGLVAARPFGPKVAAGLAVHWTRLNILGYGQTNLLHAQMGLQYQLLPQLRVGAEFSNPRAQAFTETEDERMPSALQAGFAYTFSEQLLFAAEASKVTDQELRLQAGLQYQIKPELALRGGLQTRPFSGHFGMQIKLSNVRIQFALGYHEVLRTTPVLGVDYYQGQAQGQPQATTTSSQ